MKLNWHLEKISISKLKPYEKNPRRIMEKPFKDLQKSIDKFGLAEPIIIQPSGLIIGGHARYQALKAAGTIEADCYIPDRELSESEMKELNVRLNKNVAGEFDFDILANEFEIEDLKDYGFEECELGDLGYSEEESKDAEPQIDRAEELRKKWGVETGQIWELGEHRIICGDCTDEETVKKIMGDGKADLMFTDPPYGVAIGAKNRFLNEFQKSGLVLTDIVSDQGSVEDLKIMLVKAFVLSKKVLSDQCSVFVCSPQGGELGMMMMMMMMESGLEVRHVLNWIKNCPTFSMGRLDYDYQHEPILFTWTKTHKRNMLGHFKTSVWTIDKPRANKEHPTMKPVELYENAILNHTDLNDIMYEPFCGSGTAIIAAENTNRKCRAIEISPAYVAVAIHRWVDVTGKEPKRIS